MAIVPVTRSTTYDLVIANSLGNTEGKALLMLHSMLIESKYID